MSQQTRPSEIRSGHKVEQRAADRDLTSLPRRWPLFIHHRPRTLNRTSHGQLRVLSGACCAGHASRPSLATVARRLQDPTSSHQPTRSRPVGRGRCRSPSNLADRGSQKPKAALRVPRRAGPISLPEGAAAAYLSANQTDRSARCLVVGAAFPTPACPARPLAPHCLPLSLSMARDLGQAWTGREMHNNEAAPWPTTLGGPAGQHCSSFIFGKMYPLHAVKISRAHRGRLQVVWRRSFQ